MGGDSRLVGRNQDGERDKGANGKGTSGRNDARGEGHQHMFSVRGKWEMRLEREARNSLGTATGGEWGLASSEATHGQAERMWEAESKSRLLSTSYMTLGKLTFPKAHVFVEMGTIIPSQNSCKG